MKTLGNSVRLAQALRGRGWRPLVNRTGLRAHRIVGEAADKTLVIVQIDTPRPPAPLRLVAALPTRPDAELRPPYDRDDRGRVQRTYPRDAKDHTVDIDELEEALTSLVEQAIAAATPPPDSASPESAQETS